MDYWRWAPELDVVVQRPLPDRRRPRRRTSSCRWSADLTRGLARRPAVAADGALHQRGQLAAAQRRQGARADARATASRTSPAAPTRCCFFQWRASRAGAEKFHSALVPHAGTDSRGLARGRSSSAPTLGAIAEVAGTRVRADVAIVVDWDARWAAELDCHPTSDLDVPRPPPGALPRALGRRGHASTSSRPSADLSGYRLVLVPTLYLVTDAGAAQLGAYVDGGGTALVTYCSGIVDENDHVRLGGYPGAFRDLLGVRTEEFCPLREGEHGAARRRCPRRRRGRRLDRAAAPARRRGGRRPTPTARCPAYPR